ncbi:MAG: glycoside hydrolase domain-containing protein [Candidatus Firestonebacteria bacterium]
MKKNKFLVIFFLLCNIAFCEGVWVVDDSYKVNPVEGSVLQGDSRALKIKNAVWNMSENKISLTGAKNEVISFQLIIEKARMKDLDSSSVNIEIEGINKENIEKFLEGYINVEKKWYPDLLIPLSAAINKSVPVVDGQTNQAVWVDIKIPKNISAKEYKGKVKVNAGTNKKELDLALKVLDFQIPDKRNFELDVNSYSSPVQKKWGFTSPFEEKSYELEKKYYQLVNEHRGRLNVMPYGSQSGKPNEGGYVPETSGSGADMKVTDWSKYDKRNGPYFDGSAFSDGNPISEHYLPFNPLWPSNFVNYDKNRSKYEAEWEAMAKEFIKHFKEKKWDTTIFQIFLNQKEQSGHVPWNLDEPVKKAHYEALAYYANLTHRIFKNSAPVNFKYRMDIGHVDCNHKEYRSANARKILDPIDTWVISKKHTDVIPAAVKELRNAGKTVFAYGGGSLFDASLLDSRSTAWMGWKIGYEGFCFWNICGLKKEKDPYGKADGDSNGFDLIIYPGKLLGLDEPLPSVRLKASRRGCYDYEYMVLASKIDKSKVDLIVEGCLKSKDPEAFNKAKEQLVNLITKGSAGVNINAQKGTNTKAPDKKEEAAEFCPKCDNMIPGGINRCPSCGYKLK